MPNYSAIAYVNVEKQAVLLNVAGLTQLPANKNYQLWADVEGEMINMGLVKSGENVLTMKYIENSESINLTIEPAGGSDHPTVENLIANVYLQRSEFKLEPHFNQ